MKILPSFFLVFVALSIALESVAQPHCTGPEFSEDQIREIIRRERSVRYDLPTAFENSTVMISRERCFYLYRESRVPAVIGSTSFFVLNQYGVIVDVMQGH
jgi:hypothetical protein